MLDAQTKRRIDAVRDVLVGKIPDPKTQVDQITIALIYKFMYDMDEQSRELGGRAKYFTGEFKKYAWPRLLSPQLSGHERLKLYQAALDSLPQHEGLPEIFRTVFKNALLPYRDAQILNLFLKEINHFTYDNSETLGNAFEYLLSIVGSQGDAGQFRTPRHIIDFIVEVLDPQKGDRILDPACGTAGFLISAYKHIIRKNSLAYKGGGSPSVASKSKGKDTSADFDSEASDYSFVRHAQDASQIQIQSNGRYKGEKLKPQERKTLSQNIVGYDITPEMVKLSQVNMYLHNLKNPQIFEYDTLSNDHRWGDEADVILANPPFMSPKGGIRPHDKFSIKANRSEVLFVDYIAEHLSLRGRAGVIVPEGIIFREQKAYKALRKMLVDDNFLYAVVSLPSGVFKPYSGVGTSILFLDKQLAKRQDSILFVDIQNDGFELGDTRRHIDKNDLPEAFKLLKAWQHDGGAALASTHRRDGRPQKSVENFEQVRSVETSSLVHSVKKSTIAQNHYSLNGRQYKITTPISTQWPMVKLGDVCEVYQPKTIAKKEMKIDGQYTVFGANGPIGKYNKYNHIESEVLVGCRGSCGVVNISAPMSWINGNAMVVTPKTYGRPNVATPASNNMQKKSKEQMLDKKKGSQVLMDTENDDFVASSKILHKSFLLLALKSCDFSPAISGTAQPQITRQTLSPIQIPLPPIKVQKQIVAEIEGYQKIIDGAQQVVDNWKPTFTTDPTWPTAKLGDVCEVRKGDPMAKKHALKGNIPVVAGGRSLSHYHNEANRTKATITVSASGSAGFVNFWNQPIWASDCSTIQPLKKNKACDIQFIYYTLKIMQNDIYQLKKGSSVPHVYSKDLVKFRIPFPDLKIQKQIVARIESEKQNVEACKNLIDTYKTKIDEVWSGGNE